MGLVNRVELNLLESFSFLPWSLRRLREHIISVYLSKFVRVAMEWQKFRVRVYFNSLVRKSDSILSFLNLITGGT